MRLVALASVVLALVLWAVPALPHALDPGFLELRLVGAETWRAFWKVPSVNGKPMPIDAVLPENCSPRRVPQLKFDGRAFSGSWNVDCPGGLQGGEIAVEGLESTATDVLIRYELSPGVADNRRLTPASTAFLIPAPQGKLGVLTTYVALGIEHILAGADHLLFVFALLLLIRSPGPLVGAITAFTAAHSLTLASATLGWISLPGPPVEAVIALSIMFLASELLRFDSGEVRLSQRYPWAVSFGFGLLHGLGFAGALQEIGLPQREIPLALLSFNVGVEIGQLMFIAAVLAATWLAGRLVPRLAELALRRTGYGIRIVSYAIGGTSAFWFLSRVAAF
ncbi:HupE/UreJ family protein [Defluviimonas sp. WL0024]|uniref:HupE/UreJ family protein n=1 Tax=Albidovulum salinarum TaxID=2984153 RepID=A0ABT2X7H1_9RHOB|nr:HupE/UreJ family protein [Defluviimonas sp. WL0024]MCU9849863.1 HupE/UreJ family protein [Defluviimonas sp. WL0024]